MIDPTEIEKIVLEVLEDLKRVEVDYDGNIIRIVDLSKFPKVAREVAERLSGEA